MATTWAVRYYITEWNDGAAILSPRGQSYSEIIASTIQQMDLADSSKSVVLPETKSIKSSMKFFWHKSVPSLKSQIESYIDAGRKVELTTHTGKIYTGYFLNIESELIIGTKTEQYNITAEFLPL